ncbi:homoserine dehydrogenase [Agromyces mediolanus]|uniref:Homoserine dehydrogenase n=1 Tax=Agromyces mediolanus TaxID=41986 RepID=A0A918CNS1_AGRME|nr:homoserine dehydrogenase [Agromyces mediolanus]MCD1571834.1 homoserine dehydrogenase [Agromyces mediolanus]GGR33732.1 homoserine dehydrogenase [Agromyces mediolanus]GLJ74220.1 homoserine dehydrogenase [Agromyces mediolanus]
MIEYRSIRVALLGAGSVGSQVARLLLEHRDELAQRIGARLELVGVAVRDVDARRDVELPRELLTTDAETLILGADVVIELMGGIEPARTLVLQAIGSGADVVTGNKALIAAHGPELFAAAEQVGAQLSYEAAVGGAIPIIRPLRDSLAGDRVERILGIVNGTTNFILDRMDTTGASLEDALATATELGYAEADPTADIGGYDAAQKAAILASLAFHTNVPIEDVHREGITQVSAEQVESARKAGYVVKLLAICERIADAASGEEGVSARVYPALVPRSHPLAAVHGANNAVFVEAAAAGPLMFYGAGAGGVQTASAVLGDLVAIARRHVIGGPGTAESTHAALPVLPIDRITTRYAITLEVADEPGVLATIAHVFADHGVSVEQLEQTVDEVSGRATLVIGTHEASEGALAQTVAALAASPVVVSVASVLRVEGAQ